MLILYGENTIDSSQRLVAICDEIKAEGTQVIFFDQSELTLGRLRQELSPVDLFGNSSFLVIRNLLSGTKSKNKDKLIDYLKKTNSASVLLFESKKVHPSTIKQFKGATTENFKVEINIFKFLEKITPGNTSSLLTNYQELLQKGAEPEYIFAMLVRQVRLLIQAKSTPHLLKLPAFSQRLLQSQAQKFTLDTLLNFHQDLYAIERGIKTGKSPLDMNNLLLHFLEQV